MLLHLARCMKERVRVLAHPGEVTHRFVLLFSQLFARVGVVRGVGCAKPPRCMQQVLDNCARQDASMWKWRICSHVVDHKVDCLLKRLKLRTLYDAQKCAADWNGLSFLLLCPRWVCLGVLTRGRHREVACPCSSVSADGQYIRCSPSHLNGALQQEQALRIGLFEGCVRERLLGTSSRCFRQ